MINAYEMYITSELKMVTPQTRTLIEAIEEEIEERAEKGLQYVTIDLPNIFDPDDLSYLKSFFSLLGYKVEMREEKTSLEFYITWFDPFGVRFGQDCQDNKVGLKE